MRLTQLRTNQIENPMGFQVAPLSFSWKVAEAGEAKKMKSARIQVFCEDHRIYDSGEDFQADSMDYTVDIDLKPRTRYQWSVDVTADNGECASAMSFFETGKRGEAWEAKWIAPQAGDENCQPVFRKTFLAAPEDLEQDARLYICGLGVYEVYINGKKVGSEYLAPGYHSYDFHLQVQTYDVTTYIRKGENEIQIWLGDGWFKGRLGFDGGYTNLYGDCCCAIAELYLKSASGSKAEYPETGGNPGRLLVKTDATWQYRQSPIKFSNIYDGEIYDARIEDALKEKSGWQQAALREPERCGALQDRYSLPIVKKETFTPELIRTPKKEMILDFGQNLTGWTEFDCNLPKGMAVRLTAAEILQDDCFYHDNLRTAKTEFTYISKGEKAYVRPHFTFYGFRYMKVEVFEAAGIDLTKPQLIDEAAKDNKSEKWISELVFTAYHLRSDFDQIGDIRTGNEKVNQLFLNALWGQKDNFLDVPTDCPQRDERLGWTGDAQVFSETACYNMYMPAFYRKYLWDMRAEQSILDGSVPNVVPRLKKGMVAEHGSCPWADAGVVIPWNVYQHYGNKSLLKECYPGMKAWIDYERKKEEALGGAHLIKDGFHFADWLALDNEQPGPFGATDPLYIASAYYYKGAKCVAEAAEILGDETDAEVYGKLAEEILIAIQEKYFDDEGMCICQTQTGSAMAIMFELNPGYEAAEGKALNSRIKANQNHLNTGFVGTTMLCPALTKTGDHDTAMRLLLNEEYPGWLYSVNMGATTIWERWNSVMPDGHLNSDGMNSLNHYSYGSIEAWMYGYVCGIRPVKPGFKRAVIEPHPDARLGFADLVLDTAAGVYKCSWKYNKDNTVIYEIEVPFDAEAEFIVDGKVKLLSAGRHRQVCQEK